jgi:hypothetical protein
MSDSVKRWAGGCLCGALRYEAEGEPQFAGLCCCADCRKASGSGFVPFLGFSSEAVRFTGRAQTFTSKAASGKDAVRNFCPRCGSLVHGGDIRKDDQFTIYAGTLDDPSFIPRWRSSPEIVPNGRSCQPVSKPSRRCHPNSSVRSKTVALPLHRHLASSGFETRKRQSS